MSNGLQRGRNSLVTFGPGAMPAVQTNTNAPVAGQPGLPSPNAGLTMMGGQPGTVVPTVGGVMAGLMGGRVTTPTAPPRAFAR